MTPAAVIDVCQLLDSQRLGRMHVLTIGLCFFTLFLDGLDFSIVNVAAPAILRAWQIESGAMGAVFAAGNLGLLLGSVIFGVLSDRLGRKFGIVAGVLAFSVPGIVTAFAGSVDQLALLRFITGLGIGGVIPNVVALLSEMAPKRLRLGFVVLTFVGTWVGGVAAGLLAARMIPQFGWQVVFFAPGAAGVILAVILVVSLPESIRFLALRKPESTTLRKLVQRIDPHISLGPQTRFVLPQSVTGRIVPLRTLFTEGRAIVTSVLWFGFFVESFAMIGLLSWLPVLLEHLGLSPVQASMAFAYGSACGIVAQSVTGRLLDTFGPKAIGTTSLITFLAAVLLAHQGLSGTLVTICAAISIGFAGTTHNALHGVAGALYPTSMRGKGIGYAGAVGRVGAIIGPAFVGYVLFEAVGQRQSIYFLATPYLFVVIAAWFLGRMYGTQVADDARSEILASPNTEDALAAK